MHTEWHIEYGPELLQFWSDTFTQPTTIFEGIMGSTKPENRQTLGIRSSEGKVVASVQVFAFDVRWSTGQIRLGGIGNVSTAPASRGQGLSRSLLTEAIEVMEEMGCSLSLLFTGIAPFYAALGWELLPKQTLEGDTPEFAVKPIEPGTPSTDTRWLLDRYNEGQRGSSMTVLRTEADWQYKISSRWQNYRYFELPDAYLVGHAGEEAFSVVEIGATPERTEEILLGALAWARSAGMARYRLQIPITPAVQAVVSARLNEANWVDGTDGMVRPLRLAADKDALIRELQSPASRFLSLDGF